MVEQERFGGRARELPFLLYLIQSLGFQSNVLVTVGKLTAVNPDNSL